MVVLSSALAGVSAALARWRRTPAALAHRGGPGARRAGAARPMNDPDRPAGVPAPLARGPRARARRRRPRRRRLHRAQGRLHGTSGRGPPDRGPAARPAPRRRNRGLARAGRRARLRRPGRRARGPGVRSPRPRRHRHRAASTSRSPRSSTKPAGASARATPTAPSTCYDEVLADQPANAEALTYKGWAQYILLGDTGGSPRHAHRAPPPRNRDYPDVHAFLAVVFFRSGLRPAGERRARPAGRPGPAARICSRRSRGCVRRSTRRWPPPATTTTAPARSSGGRGEVAALA